MRPGNLIKRIWLGRAVIDHFDFGMITSWHQEEGTCSVLWFNKKGPYHSVNHGIAFILGGWEKIP
jgi:hypothetical protein